METIFKLFLAVHIAGGTTALLAGIVAMIAPKGKHIHKLSGNTYYWAMAAVCASALVLSVLHPKQFLFYVAIFSFYLTFTGRRMTKRKKPSDLPTIQDWIAASLGVFAGVALFVRGGMALSESVQFGWVSVVFGGLCLFFSLSDIRSFRQPSGEKMQWFFTHLARMLGAYVATFTAFCVVNLKFLPTLAVWLVPTVMGTLAIGIWTRYYRMKFRRV